MTAMEIVTQLRPIADETAWRHVWLTNVMIDSGKAVRANTAGRARRIRKSTLTQRLRSLHLMRAALGPSR